MRPALLLPALALSCSAGLVPVGTSWERLDRRGFFDACIAQLAERGIPVAPPPALVATEKQLGLGAYQPLPRRVLLPPPRPRPAQVRRFFTQVSELMTGGRWNWRRHVPDDRTALLVHRFHIFGLVYQGLFQHLQAEGRLKPGRIDDATAYDAERVATRARIAFLRHYAERVEPRLRPLYERYGRAITDLYRSLDPQLAALVARPEVEARRYWRKQGKWLFDARSGQRVRGAFIVAWMASDLRRVDATTHARELAELKLRTQGGDR